MKISICPSCGGKKIKKVQRDWIGKFEGKNYTVPDLEFHECSDCGEMIYEREAMRRIENISPAFSKPRKEGRIAKDKCVKL